MRIAPLALLLLAAPAVAQPVEDAAHRADRLRTEALNSRSANGYPAGAADGRTRDYEAARAEYQRRLDAWRRRVAACEAGDYAACG